MTVLVGPAGFLLGGGMGDLSRMFGLACDQLVMGEPSRVGATVNAACEQHAELAAMQTIVVDHGEKVPTSER
jgi:hypothetical protein